MLFPKPRPARSLLGDPRPRMGNAERRRRGRAIVDAHLENLTAEEHSSNDRLVNTIVKSSEPGDLPDLLVRTFADHGADALPEIADMFVKTRARSPETAEKLFKGLASGLRKTGQFVNDGRKRGTLEPPPATTGRLEIEDVLGGLEDIVRRARIVFISPHSLVRRIFLLVILTSGYRPIA